MSISKTIQLSRRVNVESGARILYCYDSVEGYVRNALSFVQSALDFGQHVIFIDSIEHFGRISVRLKSERSEENLKHIHYVDRYDFFRRHGHFQFEKALMEWNETMIRPDGDEELSVRIWGHADWEQEKLHPHETHLVITAGELKYLTACCYDGQVIPASAQNAKMKSHPYLMTDNEMIHSNLHRSHRNKQSILPSHSAQYEIETEMDFYKQKLDFVHAVSHEVRNPLTIIRAYSTLLMQKAEDDADREKLKAICDYVMLIDNEISHIINTEQLLTTESLWLRKQIVPKELLVEVAEMMEVKARTQGMKLVKHISLSDEETLLSNAIGFKLIVSNILSNAIKYSREGGKVFLHVYTDNLRLHLIVKDYGVGISQEQLGLLFRKYEKINEEKGGQGIGLFMVKKLVDYFEGEIEIQSKPQEGTVVTVILPLQPDADSSESVPS